CMTLFFSRFLFFFISRRPPSSLLFPYTTLFRSAAVDLGVALLAAVAAGLADGHALDPEGLQGLLDLVQLERLDDGRDELHPLRLHLLARAFGLRRVARGRGGDRRPGRARAARPDGAEVVGRLGVDDAVEAGGLVVLADPEA